jgi:hypothetical protein
LTLEQKIVDLTQDNDKLTHKLALKDQKLHSLESDLDFARSAVEAESEVNHDQCMRLGMERQQIQEQLERALRKVEKKRAVEEEIGRVREEKQRLEEEIRRIHKEKADEKELHLRFVEEKIKIQADKIDIETKYNTLVKDNQTLESKLQ